LLRTFAAGPDQPLQTIRIHATAYHGASQSTVILSNRMLSPWLAEAGTSTENHENVKTNTFFSCLTHGEFGCAGERRADGGAGPSGLGATYGFPRSKNSQSEAHPLEYKAHQEAPQRALTNRHRLWHPAYSGTTVSPSAARPRTCPYSSSSVNHRNFEACHILFECSPCRLSILGG
jgi:hypothetical protein